MFWGEVTKTRDKQRPCVLLYDADTLVLKAYPSPDGRQIRIVLPEAKDVEGGVFTFYRDKKTVPRRGR